ncbi:5-methylcytosine-specific restriction endonuclease McrA [Desulfopila aestuarii DSM 18488]|uniref:5-methylcytosine-specific restriction endonuclease McrA n=1 Tax=Desulfopila aestuarii DSM 18488 TaxID=1121416 RepID=A0A1M7YJV1_9BACT|nr:5-methylcytosine-specific restriction endonuclease McrA [Desulfopila aestuarii DSM 18488]
MPVKTKVVCRGCRTSTSNASGYCDACRDQAGTKRRTKKGDPFYWSPQWLRFRDWYRKKSPLCEECKADGKLVPMDVVDHIVELKDGGAPLSEDNVQSLCSHCHSKKTARAKREREGLCESPPTSPAQPFGSQNLPLAKLGRGGIEKGGSHEQG